MINLEPKPASECPTGCWVIIHNTFCGPRLEFDYDLQNHPEMWNERGKDDWYAGPIEMPEAPDVPTSD